MKILFLHTNFPGQFKHICKYFAEIGHDVRFICITHYGRSIRKVQKFKIREIQDVNKTSDDRTFKEKTSTAEQYRQAFIEFAQNNWIPEIVISHSGWGCGLHVKEIWPQTKLISYLEWWFNPSSEVYTYDPNNSYLGLSTNSIHKHWLRNVSISIELASADKIVAPSNWQKKQLPKKLN